MKRIASLLLLLVFVSVTANGQYGRVPRRFKDKLPSIDKIEMQKLKPAEYGFRGVEETKTIEGQEAQKLASLWRKQKFHSMAAVCHQSIFGIKFFSRGQTIMHASICWECNNFIVLEPKLKSNSTQGFSGESKMGQTLFAEFKRIFP